MLGRGLKLPRRPFARTSEATSSPVDVRNEDAEKLRSVDADELPDTRRTVDVDETDPLLACLVGDFGGGPSPMVDACPYPNPVRGAVVGRGNDEAAAGVLVTREGGNLLPGTGGGGRALLLCAALL